MKTIIFTLALLLSATTSWAQVSNLTASNVTDSSVRLNWTGTADHFTVSRQPAGGTFCCGLTVPGTATTATHTGLAPSTSYTFLVQARNSAGAQIGSASVQATTLASAPPPPPTPVPTATATWTDNSNNEDRFELERDVGAGFVPLATISSNVTTYSDVLSGLAACSVLVYRVRACNTVGCSNFSGSASYVVPGSVPCQQATVPISPGVVGVMFSCNLPYVYDPAQHVCK